MLSELNSPRNLYITPWVVILSFEIEDTLAKSNTEHIDEDDDEYGWDD